MPKKCTSRNNAIYNTSPRSVFTKTRLATFYEEEPSDFTEKELREEAAFRCWLREIDPHDYPAALPSSTTLYAMANSYDRQYGEYAWWAWPVWSSCEHCHSKEAPMCADCESYMRYCVMSKGWTDAW